MIEINSKNFYAFEIGLSIFILVCGAFYNFNNNLFTALIVIFLSLFLIFHGTYNWSRKQLIEDKLSELKLQMQNAILDFDIKDVIAENDIEYLPEDYDEKGRPIGVEVHEFASYKIVLDIYNNTLIENMARHIDAEIIKKKVKLKFDRIEVNLPIKIAQREHVPLIFKATKFGYQGESKDKIKVILKTMDNKVIEKTFEIKTYSLGPELTEVMEIKK